MGIMRRLLAALTMGALIIGVLAGPVSASQGRPVPFQMHVVGLDRPLDMSPGFPFVGSTFDGRCSVPSTWVTTIDSTGTAAHLGHVSVTQSHCTWFDVLGTAATENPFVDGQMVITAANGDELWVHYSGYFLFAAASEAVGVSDIHYETMTIVGGTGRFEGASGSLTGRARDDFPTGPNAASYAGTIVYDPSVQASH
jgi:hypothetical protein